MIWIGLGPVLNCIPVFRTRRSISIFTGTNNRTVNRTRSRWLLEHFKRAEGIHMWLATLFSRKLWPICQPCQHKSVNLVTESTPSFNKAYSSPRRPSRFQCKQMCRKSRFLIKPVGPFKIRSQCTS